MMRGSWVLAALALMQAAAAQGAVSVSERTETYAVRGATPTDLRREMRAKGPAGAGGRRFDGRTDWQVSWRYWYRRVGGQCRIDRTEISVEVTFIMPRWENERAAAADALAGWRHFVAKLQEHEDGHRRNGVDAGHEIDRTLAALPPEPSCDAMGARANAVAHGIIRKYNQRDLEYDSATDHGRTQGVRLP